MGLSGYIHTALERARYKILKDGSYFGEIPGLKGVWAQAKSLEHCRQELQEVLEDWIVIKLHDRDRLPKIDGHTLKIPVHA